MMNIIKRRIREQTMPVFYYTLGLILYAWMMIGFYPSMQKNMNLEEYLKQMPEGFIKLFSAGQELSFAKIEGFLSMEYLSLFFVLIIVAFIGSVAGSTIAGSIEKKTMDFQLSQPVSRIKYVLADVIIGLASIYILVSLTSISMYFLCRAYDLVINGRGLFSFGLVATVFLWAFYGISILFSSFSRSKISVTMMTLMVTLAFYIFSSLTTIVEKLNHYDKFSIFYLYRTQEILTTGEIHWSHIGILLMIFLSGLAGSLIIFNRRDV